MNNKQLNIRLYDSTFIRIELLKQKLGTDNTTYIIELALNALCENCGVSVDDIVNSMHHIKG